MEDDRKQYWIRGRSMENNAQIRVKLKALKMDKRAADKKLQEINRAISTLEKKLNGLKKDKPTKKTTTAKNKTGACNAQRDFKAEYEALYHEFVNVGPACIDVYMNKLEGMQLKEFCRVNLITSRESKKKAGQAVKIWFSRRKAID